MCDEKSLAGLEESIDGLMPKITALDKTLAVTNTNMTHLTKEVTEIAKENSKMRETVYGNGNPKGGLSSRLDRIETWIEGQVWFQRLIIAVLVGGLIKAAYDFFF